MSYRRFSWLVAIPLAMALAGHAWAEDKKGDEDKGQAKSGAGVLQDHGLRKAGPFYALPEEAELAKKYKEIEPLRKKVTDGEKKAREAEKKIDLKKQQVIYCLQMRRQLEAQLDGAKNADVHSRIVNKMNELGDNLNLMEKSHEMEDAAKTARSAATDISEHYVELIMQLRKGYDAAKEKYETLAADEEVKKALDEVNKDSTTKYKLGPTNALSLLDRNLKKLETTFASEVIQMRKDDGDSWHVSATFDGRAATDLLVDTGCSDVALSSKVADKLGLTPSAKDPTFRCVLADGREVECKLVYAKTVRVGRFTVEHVPCGVMPADCPKAASCLGMAFMRNFVCKIDNGKGKLYLTEIEQPGGKRRTKVAHGATKEAAKAVMEEVKKDVDKDEPRDLATYLKLADDGEEHQGMTINYQSGPVAFAACKQEPAEDLVKKFGQPDEMHKLARSGPGGVEEPAWKIYEWGKVRVIIDDSGLSRFFTVIKAKQ
jgi:clan AA aspartic protease (TIGR02281 family)